MSISIARRLQTLEQQARRTSRPTVAFVLWERTQELVEEAYSLALEMGAIQRSDPVIRGVMPLPAPLPGNRWTDGTDLTEGELAQIAYPPGDEGLHSPLAMNRSDAELAEATIAGTARCAS